MKKLISLILLSFFTQHSFAQSVTTISWEEKREIDQNVITVKPKDENSRLLKTLDVIRSNILDYFDISVPAGMNAEEFVSLLEDSGEFEVVEHNIITKIAAITSNPFDEKATLSVLNTSYNEKSALQSLSNMSSTVYPNDPYYNQQVLLGKINVPNAWGITMGESSVKVALIDTGIDSTHVDLGIGTDGYTNISESLGINCDLWLGDHGTAVAGVIGAKTNNGIGMAGIAGGNNCHGATMVPYFVGHFTDSILVNWALVDDYILDAVSEGADIILIGFMREENSSSMSSAINYAYNHGVTVICGSGEYSLDENEQKNVMYPAANNKVIAVGACEFYTTTGADYRWFPKSGYGTGLDIVAPGFYAFSTMRNQSYSQFLYGTFIAAAHVAGVVALMLSVNTQLTPAHVRQILRDTAIKSSYYSYTNGFNQFVGYGLVDAFAAVEMAPYYISGNNTLCQSDVYYVVGLPTGATVTWTLSGSEASKFNLVQNSPSTNKCTITKKANAVFNSSSFNLTLTAKIYQGGTLIKTKTKTLTCNNGFACTYWQDAHEYYGVNYPAITQTQMTSVTNYVYPGGMVFLQSDYFRGKVITTSGIFDNFQYVGQNTVKFSLPPYSSSPAYINVAADGCDEAVQLTFYPMTYYAMSGYSAQMSAIGSQEYRVSLVSNERSSSDEEIPFSEDVATVMNADNPVSWTVEAINAMTGRKMFSTEPKGTDYVLNTSNWESGLYVVRVIVAGEPIFAGKVTK